MTTTTEPVAVEFSDDATDELLTRASALVPMFREHAERTERDRRIVDENMVALREAGLLRLFVPRAHGGYDLGMRSGLVICAELARGCGSTSWIATLLNANAYTLTSFSTQAQQEVFGDNPDSPLCGVIRGSSVETERVDGGYVISGRWGFASGSLHADWAVLGNVPLPAADGGEPQHGGVLLPMSVLTVEDTWYVAGMRGTGSNTLVAHRAFAPDHRVLTATRTLTEEDLDGRVSASGDADRRAVVHAVRRAVLVFGLVAPFLGMAQQAFELVSATLEKGKHIAYSDYADARESPAVQLTLTKAQQLIDSSWLHAFRAADELDDAMAGRADLNLAKQTRIRTDSARIAQQCRAAVQLLLDINGAGSFAEKNPLQRIWRDIEVASRHGIINPLMAQEIAGRVSSGLGRTVVWGE